MGRNFFGTVEERAKLDSWNARDRGSAYAALYREHLDEAFSACIKVIRDSYPDAQLVYVGSDLGGPLYEIDLGDEVTE